MKTLYLLRHAKSDWSRPGLEDFERPLAPRGIAAAPRMGRAMAARGWRPAAVLCSAARRARETWDRLGPALLGDADHEPPVAVRKDLYGAAPAALLAAVRGSDDDWESLLVIGHNPELEALAAALCGEGSDAEALEALRRKYPTAALAVLEFDVVRWRDVGPGRGRLAAFLRPKDLEGKRED